MTLAAPPPLSPRTATGRTTPYQGLRPYTEADAAFFFGRDEWRDTIIDNLLAHPLTLLYGESGVGKTSVLRAGVVPELRRRNAAGEGPPLAAAAFDEWRDAPIEGLGRCLATAVGDAVGDPTITVSDDQELAVQLDDLADRLQGRLIVILDQFELYFVYHGRSSDERLSVALPETVGSHNLRVHYLIAIREDALAKLDAFRAEIPQLFDNMLRIEPLDRRSARAAIVKPIDRYNELTHSDVTVEPALIDAVLDEIDAVGAVFDAGGRGVSDDDAETGGGIQAPYLQLVMQRLWREEDQAGSGALRRQTLERLGGSAAIVRHHLDDAMATLSPRERAIAAQTFHFLVTPSGTKFAHTAPDLAAYTEMPEEAIGAVLEKLAAPEIRIIRRLAPPPGRGDGAEERPPRYEIFHDALGPAVLDWRLRELARDRPTMRRTFLDLRRVWITTLIVNTVLLGVGLGILVLVPGLRLVKPQMSWHDIGRVALGWLLGWWLGALIGVGIGVLAWLPFHDSQSTFIGFGSLVGMDVTALLGAIVAARKPNRRRLTGTS